MRARNGLNKRNPSVLVRHLPREGYFVCAVLLPVLLTIGCAASPGGDGEARLGHEVTRREGGETRPRVRILTELGEVVVEIYADRAPVTAANFLRYVDENRYRSASFYRVVTMRNQEESPVKIEVVQGGIGFVESDLRLPPIAHETTEMSGVRHGDGVISMARREPGTASSEFFICVGDQPELDYGGARNPDGQGFAPFGRVMSGMDVVRKIHVLPESGQMLDQPVRIIEITRT